MSGGGFAQTEAADLRRSPLLLGGAQGLLRPVRMLGTWGPRLPLLGLPRSLHLGSQPLINLALEPADGPSPKGYLPGEPALSDELVDRRARQANPGLNRWKTKDCLGHDLSLLVTLVPANRARRGSPVALCGLTRGRPYERAVSRPFVESTNLAACLDFSRRSRQS